MYNFQPRFYKEKIDAIEANDLRELNALLTEQGVQKISTDAFENICDQYTKYTKKLFKDFNDKALRYGIYGKAAPMYGNGKILPGGATQILFPLSIAYMQLLGMLYLA